MSVLFIWNTVNQMFFFNFLLYSSFTAPSPNMENEQFLIEQTWRSTEERRSLEQTNQWLILIFQWKLNKQRCNCDRMRDKDIKFIHIISIVTVVYNNGINLKYNNNLQIAPCIVSLAHVRIQKWFSSNFNQPASIRLCTLCFRVIQCSMECPVTPPW